MRSGLGGWVACGVALWLTGSCAWGGTGALAYMGNLDPALDQFRLNGACGVALWRVRRYIIPPLYVGNIEPVLDPYGHPMSGTIDDLPADRSRVEILTTTDGVIHAPSVNGDAHPNNPLLLPDSVGGIGMNSIMPGVFCMVFPSRPATGRKVFARAFNAPTVAESSFYADSAITFAPATDSSLVQVFGVAQPLDSGDADGDGLINSWEKALGTDGRLTNDFDEDGIDDLGEMLAGTSPTDPESLLAFKSIQRDESTASAKADGTISPLRVRFQSVPGKSYQIELALRLPGEQIFLPVGEVVTAGNGEFETEVLAEIPEETTSGMFRVRLVRE